MNSQEKNKYIVEKSIELFKIKKALTPIADCWHESVKLKYSGMECKCGKDFAGNEILCSNPDFSTPEGILRRTKNCEEGKIVLYEYSKGDGLLWWMMYGLKENYSKEFFFNIQTKFKQNNPHFIEFFLDEYMNPPIFREEVYNFLERYF